MRFCWAPACRLYFLWDSVDRFCLRPAVAKAFEIFGFFTRFWMRSWCVYLSENQHIPKGNDIFQPFIFRGFSRLVSGSVTKRFPQNIGLPSTWAGWSEKFPTDKNSTTAELLNSNNMSRGCQRCKKQKHHIRKEVPPPQFLDNAVTTKTTAQKSWVRKEYYFFETPRRRWPHGVVGWIPKRRPYWFQTWEKTGAVSASCLPRIFDFRSPSRKSQVHPMRILHFDVCWP